jgi:glycogen debranching enzyme
VSAPRKRVATVCLMLLLSSVPTARPRAQAPPPTTPPAQTPTPAPLLPKFQRRQSRLALEGPARAGRFYDVTGRRAALFGYEHRAAEVWVHPLKILDRLEISFRVEGYPLEFSGADTLARVSTRPEATAFTYSHAAFTVTQTIFAPANEPGVVMLFEVESALPLQLSVSFRPRLRLAWPAGLMTGNLSWDEKARLYFITEESRRYVGVVGSPRARDASVMPYQEEPRDVPARFTVDVAPEEFGKRLVPVVVVGSVEGREHARAAYQRILTSIPALYERTAAHYEKLLAETTSVETPDPRLDEAFDWARVGIEKGVVASPLLGTGLVAGYRTSGESERPGFAWYFGRDSLWTALATTAYGDWQTTRDALAFLRKYQRADGKIPHEISQSAPLLPWFTDYKYAWDSADATPLYIVAHADYFRASGDRKFLQDNWESIVRAFRFTEATDTDKNGLVENTAFGHGWVEGGDLYPPHEEIYQQGVWIAAARALAELASVAGDVGLGERASAAAERTREATERTYWLPGRSFYAYATKRPTKEPVEAERGPNRAARQLRLNELAPATLFDEDTVMPAVPLWFKLLDGGRAQTQIDRLGSAALATDWGARLLSAESRLYDPLSYHHGSVWPLFTGWAALAAYNYGRPHVGRQALTANALLTCQGSPGHVTELLSGEFNAPFGRSSHHQIWSQAMVAAPVLRGLFGLEVTEAGNSLRFAPQLPADWDGAAVKRVRVGGRLVSLALSRRGPTETRILVSIESGDGGADAKPGTNTAPLKLTVAPAFPLDARVQSVAVGPPRADADLKLGRARKRPADFSVTREGDVQRAAAAVKAGGREIEFVFTHTAGTDVYFAQEQPAAGARAEGLRVLRSRASGTELRLTLEGVAGREYALRVRGGKTPGVAAGQGGLTMTYGAGDPVLRVRFEGPAGTHVRREIALSLREPPSAPPTARPD